MTNTTGRPPERGEVQRLVERTLVGCPLAGDGDGDATGALALERERLTARHRVALGDDAGAREVGDRVEEVHVAPLAATEARLAAVDLGRHAFEVDAVRDRQVVRDGAGPVMASSVLRWAQTPAATGSWPAARCISPGIRPAPMSHCGFLSAW